MSIRSKYISIVRRIAYKIMRKHSSIVREEAFGGETRKIYMEEDGEKDKLIMKAFVMTP